MKRRNKSLERSMASKGIASLAAGHDAARATAFPRKHDIVKQQLLIGCMEAKQFGRSTPQGLRNAESRQHQPCGDFRRRRHLPVRPVRGIHCPFGSTSQVAACG